MSRSSSKQPQVNRKIKQGPVDIDYDESALVVNYEIETVSPCTIKSPQ